MLAWPCSRARPLPQAAQRYAAPDAHGGSCKQSEPCSLADAINGASADDEVIVSCRRIPDHRGADQRRRRRAADPRRPRRADAADHPLSSAGCRRSASTPTVPRSAISKSSTRRRRRSAVDCFEPESRSSGSARSASAKAPAGLVQIRGCLVRDSLLRGQGHQLARYGVAGDRSRRTGCGRPQRDRDRDRRRTRSGSSPGTATAAKAITPSCSATRSRAGAPSTSGPKTLGRAGEHHGLQLQLRHRFRKGSGGDLGRRQPDRPAALPRRRCGRLPRGPGIADDRRRLDRRDRAARPRRQPAPARACSRHRRIRVRSTAASGGGAALTSLSVSPKSFRPRSAGEAIVSRARRGRERGRPSAMA